MSSFFGETSTPNHSWWWLGIGLQNQVASQFTMPVQGNISAIAVYMAGHWNAVSARGVIWEVATNAVIRNTTAFSAKAGGGYQGGQSWHNYAVTTYLANQSEALWLGFWRDPAGRAEWSLTSSGYFRCNGGSGTTSPASFAGFVNPGNPQGTIGAYCAYTGATGSPAGGGSGSASTSRIELWNGTAWVQKPLNIWSGTAWVQKPLERWSGTAWS